MLHPNQFEVNEAWIAFRLNDAPIRTELEGDFNCVAFMDAASCFILATGFVPANEAEMSKLESRRLLNEAYAHKRELPKTLFIPAGQLASNLAAEAQRKKITVVRVEEDQLVIFIGEARQTFKEHFGASDDQ